MHLDMGRFHTNAAISWALIHPSARFLHLLSVLIGAMGLHPIGGRTRYFFGRIHLTVALSRAGVTDGVTPEGTLEVTSL